MQELVGEELSNELSNEMVQSMARARVQLAEVDKCVIKGTRKQKLAEFFA